LRTLLVRVPRDLKPRFKRTRLAKRSVGHPQNSFTVFLRRDVTYIGDSAGIEVKSVGTEFSRMSKPMTRQASTSQVGAEPSTDDTSRTPEEKSIYEMLLLVTHSLNQMNRRYDEDHAEFKDFRAEYAKDREEFRTFKKRYEMDREERNRTNTELRKEILSIAQKLDNLTRDVRNLQNNRVAVKQDIPQVSTETHQNYPTNLHETVIRPDSPSLEDVAPNPTRSWQRTLRDIVDPIPVFNGYNPPLSQFIRECREVQTAVSPDEEANVLILLRGKLRGRARQALQGRRFTNINQLIDRLQVSFGVSRESCVWYAELDRFCLGRRESIAAYIERAQILYDNIIEAERYEKQSLAESDITRINGWFIDEFYCGLPSSIQTLVEKRDARTPVEIYEMVENANKKLEKKYNSQPPAYAASSRKPR